MNISKFTQKSVEAVQNCEKLAYEYGNQEIEEEHLLYSLLTIEDSLILKLIEKMEIQKEHFVDRSKQALAKRVKVQGGQVYIGKDLNQVLIHAEDEAKQMGDEYVSVEHLFLSMLQYPNKEIKQIFTSMASRGSVFYRRCPRCAAIRESFRTIRRLLMIHWRSTDRIW